MLKSMLFPLALVLATPALAIGTVSYVPSTWPADGAFDTDKTTRSPSPKGPATKPVRDGK